VTILIKPLLYLMVLGQVAVLFASTIGLISWLLMKCVRAIAALRPPAIGTKSTTLKALKSDIS
jgi:hypothetical protein